MNDSPDIQYHDIDLYSLEVRDSPRSDDKPYLRSTEKEGVTLLRLYCSNRGIYYQQALIKLSSGHTIEVVKCKTFGQFYVVNDNDLGLKELNGRFLSPERLLDVLAKANREGRLQHLPKVTEEEEAA